MRCRKRKEENDTLVTVSGEEAKGWTAALSGGQRGERVMMLVGSSSGTLYLSL